MVLTSERLKDGKKHGKDKQKQSTKGSYKNKRKHEIDLGIHLNDRVPI